MIHQFLSAKHWHLFMLILVLPLLTQMVTMVLAFDSAIAGILNHQSHFMSSFFLGFILVMIFQIGGIFGWMWSVSVGLHSKLPSTMRMNLKQFKFFFVFPIIYFVVFLVTMILFVTKMESFFNHPNPHVFPFEIFPIIGGLLILFPLHLFSMFCIGYCFQFSAKTLKSIELGRRAETVEYIGEFFLFWFSFVGVWIMQPRITIIYFNSPDRPSLIEQEPKTPKDDFSSVKPAKKEGYVRGEKLRGKDHDAFRHDDEFDGLI